MKNFIFISIILLTISCTKETITKEEKPSNELNGFNIITGMNIHFININGEDLLDPTTPNYLPFNKMRLYYLVNGKKIAVETLWPVFSGFTGLGLDTTLNPYHFYILDCATDCDYNNGLISEVNGVKKGVSITYLEINEGITDTIKAEWEAGYGYFKNTKMWYNGTPVEYFFRDPFTVVK